MIAEWPALIEMFPNSSKAVCVNSCIFKETPLVYESKILIKIFVFSLFYILLFLIMPNFNTVYQKRSRCDKKQHNKNISESAQIWQNDIKFN